MTFVLPQVVCPHGRRVEGATPDQSGVVCGAMERDQARADPILEGAPVGVIIRAGENPSTLGNLCCGTGDPVVDPDELRHRRFGTGHYSACPIFVADREIQQVEDRLFGDVKEPDPVGTEELPLTDDEARFVASLGG